MLLQLNSLNVNNQKSFYSDTGSRLHTVCPRIMGTYWLYRLACIYKCMYIIQSYECEIRLCLGSGWSRLTGSGSDPEKKYGSGSRLHEKRIQKCSNPKSESKKKSGYTQIKIRIRIRNSCTVSPRSLVHFLTAAR